jgi:hypothetical protein
MQKLLVPLLALFAFGLLYILHEWSQINRYQSNSAGSFVLDSKTGALYGLPESAGGEPRIILAPIQPKP